MRAHGAVHHIVHLAGGAKEIGLLCCFRGAVPGLPGAPAAPGPLACRKRHRRWGGCTAAVKERKRGMVGMARPAGPARCPRWFLTGHALRCAPTGGPGRERSRGMWRTGSAEAPLWSVLRDGRPAGCSRRTLALAESACREGLDQGGTACAQAVYGLVYSGVGG